jgi:hypothetical protein
MIGAVLSLVLTASQVMALNQAYMEGSLYGLGRYFQAVVLVESSACAQKLGDDGRSLGCSQLSVSTAQTICNCSVSRRLLLDDDRTNLRIGAKFLASCFQRFYPDKQRSTICYNLGPFKAATLTDYQVKHSRYVAKVKAYLRQLQQIPVDTK